MKFYQLSFFLTIAFFGCSFLAVAQTKAIPVKAASLPNGKVLISYDLSGEKPTQKYTIKVYCSYNNYLTPLRKVTGDVGANIAVGTGKEIEWDPAEELGNYKGDIDFRVVGELIAMPIVFITPTEGGSVRRGKKTMVQWEGGMPDQDVQLELFQNSQRLQSLTGSKNTGSYNWQLPSDMKKGSYTLNLIVGNETVQSGVFMVKSKIPLGVKLLPVLLLGGAAAAFSGGGGGDDNGGTVGSADLPVAPGPK